MREIDTGEQMPFARSSCVRREERLSVRIFRPRTLRPKSAEPCSYCTTMHPQQTNAVRPIPGADVRNIIATPGLKAMHLAQALIEHQRNAQTMFTFAGELPRHQRRQEKAPRHQQGDGRLALRQMARRTSAVADAPAIPAGRPASASARGARYPRCAST